MLKIAKILNEETKVCAITDSTEKEFIDLLKEKGFNELDVEQAYDGNWYLVGYEPQEPREEKAERVRNLRNDYLEQYVDPVVSNPLRWAELTEDEQNLIKDYRQYLLDIPETDGFPYIEVLTYDEWCDKK